MWRFIGLLAVLVTVAVVAPAKETTLDWKEVLGPPQGTIPKPQTRVFWRKKLKPALAEAQRENRPLFVTFRCLPCKQCASFDQAVLEGGPELDPVLKHFVTVRLTDARAIDLRLFPVAGFQDWDMSWWGWFLSPDGRVYGVFGGRDDVSDATRISVPALAAALKRVLSHHHDPRRAGWNLDGPTPDLEGKAEGPRTLPGYESWLSQTRERPKKCLHCHQVGEILRQPALDARTFDTERDLGVWPLPENVGITVDRDDGLKVTAIVADSPAARAGLQRGDVFGAAGGRRLFSQTDLRGALHRGPLAKGSIAVAWTRAGRVRHGKLEVADGWRNTKLDWRMSVSQGNIGAHPGFWPLPARGGTKPWFGKGKPAGPAARAGLRHSDVVTMVDGEAVPGHGRTFLVWFRLRYDPGDAVTLTVRDARGKTREIEVTLE